MRTTTIALVLGLLFSPAATRADADHLLLVMPIFGVVPPELRLPDPGRIAESLMLELPASIRVVAEEPAGKMVPDNIEALVRARASEQGAAAVIWGELRPPSFCRASRVVRLRILETRTGMILDRDLCPDSTTPATLSRALALATVNALGSGLVKSLALVDRPSGRKSRLRTGIPRAPRKCPPCPESMPCPEPGPCPPVAQAACQDTDLPAMPGLMLAAGPLFTSHPRWEAYGLGAAVELSLTALPWLEVGLGMRATRGRQVGENEVVALYTSWPGLLWGRMKFGSRSLEATVDLGVLGAWTRLEALLERFNAVRSEERFNLAVFGRAGIRWWLSQGAGLHLMVGSTVYLRRQTYTYGVGGLVGGVLTMEIASLEAMLLLVVPIQ